MRNHRFYLVVSSALCYLATNPCSLCKRRLDTESTSSSYCYPSSSSSSGRDIKTRSQLLAHHWTNADDIPKALDYLERGGDEAARMGNHGDVIEMLTMAEKLLRELVARTTNSLGDNPDPSNGGVEKPVQRSSDDSIIQLTMEQRHRVCWWRATVALSLYVTGDTDGFHSSVTTVNYAQTCRRNEYRKVELPG